VTEPFFVHPSAGPARLVYDSPHSGRFYPPDFATKASRTELRRGEDAYVDRLLAGSTDHGAALLAATYPRCYIDVNRGELEIDEAVLAEPWPGTLAPTEKSRRGLGLIRRYVVPGVEAQRGPLTPAEVRRRIEVAYRPYHARLRELIDEVHLSRGVVWHVNWHSMKSRGNAMTPDGPGAMRPDFVVSDVRGRSASPHVTALVVETLASFGYRVSVNDPYTGGTIVQQVGDPARGVHSVQVEINRALYLDEVDVSLSAGFSRLAREIDAFTRRLSAALDAEPTVAREQ
jgi:N-formylglutamate deformylase